MEENGSACVYAPACVCVLCLSGCLSLCLCAILCWEPLLVDIQVSKCINFWEIERKKERRHKYACSICALHLTCSAWCTKAAKQKLN